MDEELMEAKRLFDDLLGPDVLGHWEVVQMPSRNPRARLYGCRPTIMLAINNPPVAIADRRGVHLLDCRKWADAWAYAYDHGLEPPRGG